MEKVITENNIDEILAAGQPVLVDFWAPWCGPCRTLSPLIDELSEKFAGKVNIVKCDVDESADVPARYGVRNIPTLLFFKGGELTDRLVGLVAQSEIEDKINSLI